MTALRIIIAVLLALAGVALVGAGCFTWGVNNHAIGFPYREMVGLGLALIGLAAWVAFA